MGTTTNNYLLPRPVGADDANVPLWFTDLTNRLESLLNGGGADAGLGLWSVGDFKISSRQSSHGRWLFCDGRALTQAQIESELGIPAGSASILVNLWGTGNASWYDTADNTPAGQVRLPDARGRAISCVGTGAGLTTRPRGTAYGAEQVTLSAAQSGVPAHLHPEGSLSVDGHTHAFLVTSEIQPGGQNRNYIPGSDSGQQVAGPAHTHLIGGNTAGAAAGSGSTANNAPAGAASGHDNVGPSFALGNLFVRV